MQNDYFMSLHALLAISLILPAVSYYYENRFLSSIEEFRRRIRKIVFYKNPPLAPAILTDRHSYIRTELEALYNKQSKLFPVLYSTFLILFAVYTISFLGILTCPDIDSWILGLIITSFSVLLLSIVILLFLFFRMQNKFTVFRREIDIVSELHKIYIAVRASGIPFP